MLLVKYTMKMVLKRFIQWVWRERLHFPLKESFPMVLMMCPFTTTNGINQAGYTEHTSCNDHSSVNIE